EARPGSDRSLREGEVVVRHDEPGIDLEAGSQPVAALAGTIRRVEREVPRRELVEGEPAMRAGQVLGERQPLGTVAVIRAVAVAGDDLDLGDPLGESERRLQ